MERFAIKGYYNGEDNVPICYYGNGSNSLELNELNGLFSTVNEAKEYVSEVCHLFACYVIVKLR